MLLNKSLVFFFVLFCIGFTACSQPSNNLKIEAKELEHLTGLYTGELNYKDYNLDGNTLVKLLGNCYFKKDTMNIDITINEKGTVHHYTLKYQFKGGTIFHESETKILEKQIDYDKQIMDIVFSRDGKDDDKSCTFKYEMQAGINKIVISKFVKYQDKDDYFKRNEYTLNRY